MRQPERAETHLIVDFGVLVFIGIIGAVATHDCAGTIIAAGLDGEFLLVTDGERQWRRVAVVPAGRPRAVDGQGRRMAVCLVDPDVGLTPGFDPEAVVHAAQALAQDTGPADWRRFREAIGVGPCADVPDRRIAQVAGAIRASSSDLVPVDVLADSVGLSASRLEHLFKAQVGCPIRSFRTWCRFRTAAEAITAGESLTTAAHEAGFYDSAHFTRAFRQSFGIPPSFVFSSALRAHVIAAPVSSRLGVV